MNIGPYLVQAFTYKKKEPFATGEHKSTQTKEQQQQQEHMSYHFEPY